MDLKAELSKMRERLAEIAADLRQNYGPYSAVLIRAEKVSAAVQELQWEIDRAEMSKTVPGPNSNINVE
jgi:hypothetical protein